MDDDEVQLLDQSDLQISRKNRSKGVPVFFAEDPPVSLASSPVEVRGVANEPDVAIDEHDCSSAVSGGDGHSPQDTVGGLSGLTGK